MTRQTIRLRIADFAARHLEVQHTIHGVVAGDLALRMPVWCPGSYVVRDYAGHVSRFVARQGNDELEHRKLDKTTWSIGIPVAGDVTVTYRVFAPELTVRTNDVNHEHAFVHPPATFFAVDGRTQDEITLGVDTPADWTVSTALPTTAGNFVARDVDHLFDSPLEIGPHTIHRFETGGRSHEFVAHGSGNADIGRVVADTQKIVETELEFFGDEAPYERYLFILHLVASRAGGLEHDDSCVLAWPKLEFSPEDKYRDFLTLVAHEFFHVWIVRRTRPEVLTSYDYGRETYTRLLWVFEGFTTYYQEIFPVRAGCYGVDKMLERLADHVRHETAMQGRLHESLEESSFDSWVGLYRPGPDSRNSRTHYYLKGALVAWKLDLLLRHRTEGRASLDDVIRHLWQDYGRVGKGVPEGSMGAVVRDATGVDVDAFLEEHVRQPGRLELEDSLATIGLRLRHKPVDADSPEPAWIGVRHEAVEGGARLTHVDHEGPAHAAGLMAEDVLIAVDGHRLGGDLGARLKILSPGEVVTWTAFRADRLVQGRLTLGHDPIGTLQLVPIDEPTDAQRAAFAAWSGVGLDALNSAD